MPDAKKITWAKLIIIICVVVMTQLLNRALWPRGSEGLSPYCVHVSG